MRLPKRYFERARCDGLSAKAYKRVVGLTYESLNLEDSEDVSKRLMEVAIGRAADEQVYVERGGCEHIRE